MGWNLSLSRPGWVLSPVGNVQKDWQHLLFLLHPFPHNFLHPYVKIRTRSLKLPFEIKIGTYS